MLETVVFTTSSAMLQIFLRLTSSRTGFKNMSVNSLLIMHPENNSGLNNEEMDGFNPPWFCILKPRDWQQTDSLDVGIFEQLPQEQ